MAGALSSEQQQRLAQHPATTLRRRSADSGNEGILQAATTAVFCKQQRRQRSAGSGDGGAVQAAATAAFCRQRRLRRATDGGDGDILGRSDSPYMGG
eukprot:5670829-Pleurochrysis_carterae.AAC.1